MIRPDVRLHIEELVLHGFAPGDRYAIAHALEQELSLLLTNYLAEGNDLARLNWEQERVDAGAFQVEPRTLPDGIGTQVAQAVHGVLIK
jgi:hypothetical protein